MASARKTVANKGGATVVDGHEMRAAADDRGHPRAIVKNK